MSLYEWGSPVTVGPRSSGADRSGAKLLVYINAYVKVNNGSPSTVIILTIFFFFCLISSPLQLCVLLVTITIV